MDVVHGLFVAAFSLPSDLFHLSSVVQLALPPGSPFLEDCTHKPVARSIGVIFGFG